MDKIKRWAKIGGIIGVLVLVGFLYFKPPQIIENTRAILFTIKNEKKVADLEAEVGKLKKEKSEIEKKLKTTESLAKNVQEDQEIVEAFDKEGRLTSRITRKKTTDLSTTILSTDSQEVAKTEISEEERQKIRQKIQEEFSEREKQILLSVIKKGSSDGVGAGLAIYAPTDLSAIYYGVQASAFVDPFMIQASYIKAQKDLIGVSLSLKVFGF